MSCAQTDWRALCEELISLVERCPVTGDTDWIAERNELIVQVHGARRALLAQPEHEVARPTQDELWELWLRLDRELPDRPVAVAAFWEHAQVEARSRFGRPAPAPAGEVEP